MVSVNYDGRRFSVLQTETIALPARATEIYSSISGTDVIFRFNRRDGDEVNVDVQHSAGGAITFSIHGFHNPLGSSFDAMVGDIAGKQLKLAAIAHGVGEQENPPRLVTFTFLLEE